MTLEQNIMQDLKAAMIAKDEVALRSLRAIKAAILLAKTAEAGKTELSQDEEMKILQKMAKQRKESMEIFSTQNRKDLADKEADELKIIEKFLPKQMDETEVRAAIKGIIAETGASSPADMGKVMGATTKALAGKADGKMISTIVKELLAGA